MLAVILGPLGAAKSAGVAQKSVPSPSCVLLLTDGAQKRAPPFSREEISFEVDEGFSDGGGDLQGEIFATANSEFTYLGDITYGFVPETQVMEIVYYTTVESVPNFSKTPDGEPSKLAGQSLRKRGVSQLLFEKLFELHPDVAVVKATLAKTNAAKYFEVQDPGRLQNTPFFKSVSKFGFNRVLKEVVVPGDPPSIDVVLAR